MRYVAVTFLLLCCTALVACGTMQNAKLTFDDLPPVAKGEDLPKYLAKAMFTHKPVNETKDTVFFNAFSPREDKVEFVGRISDIMTVWTEANQRSTGCIDMVLVRNEGHRISPVPLYSALLQPLAPEAKNEEFEKNPEFFYYWVDSTGTNKEQWRNGTTGSQYIVLAQGAWIEKMPRGYSYKKGIHWNVFILQGEILKAALKNVAQVHARAQKNIK